MVTDAQLIDGYAAALLEVARAEGRPDVLSAEVAAVAHQFGTSDELRTTLSDPQVPFERKQGVVSDLLGKRASAVTIALVNMLIGSGRIGDFETIAERMMALAAEAEDEVVAEITSAVDLDDATVARITDKLAEATGRRLRPQLVVDPTLLGGVVAKVGDTVFDGSVRSRLQDLREAWG